MANTVSQLHKPASRYNGTIDTVRYGTPRYIYYYHYHHHSLFQIELTLWILRADCPTPCFDRFCWNFISTWRFLPIKFFNSHLNWAPAPVTLLSVFQSAKHN
jgi:hypothetical protein